jgi:hypothetical protein
MDIQGVGWGGRNWIHLASDSDRWYAVLKAVMTLSDTTSHPRMPDSLFQT